MAGKYIAVFVTCSCKEQALKIAKKLLDERLAACANIVQGVESLFWWRGKVDKAREALIILKTSRRNFDSIEKMVRKLHSYEVPEIIALPITRGEKNYLGWISSSIER